MCRTSDPAKRCHWHLGESGHDFTDFDHEVVRRLLAGERVGAVRRFADTLEAVRRMARAGWSDGQIAYRLGCHRRSVWRIRARYAIPAALPVGATKGVSGIPNRPVQKG